MRIRRHRNPKAFTTPQEEQVFLETEKQMDRARIYEAGAAAVLNDHACASELETCVVVLSEAVQLRKDAWAKREAVKPKEDIKPKRRSRKPKVEAV